MAVGLIGSDGGGFTGAWRKHYAEHRAEFLRQVELSKAGQADALEWAMQARPPLPRSGTRKKGTEVGQTREQRQQPSATENAQPKQHRSDLDQARHTAERQRDTRSQEQPM